MSALRRPCPAPLCTAGSVSPPPRAGPVRASTVSVNNMPVYIIKIYEIIINILYYSYYNIKNKFQNNFSPNLCRRGGRGRGVCRHRVRVAAAEQKRDRSVVDVSQNMAGWAGSFGKPAVTLEAHHDDLGRAVRRDGAVRPLNPAGVGSWAAGAGRHVRRRTSINQNRSARNGG